MKTLIAVVAIAAAVLLIKPKSIKEEVFNLPVENTTQATKAPLQVKQVKKITLNEKRVVQLFSPVDGISTASVISSIKSLQNSEEPIYLLIDSPGGSVLDGAQIISAMEASKAPVNTVCLRLCASMGFVIHQYGKKRMAVDRSLLMAHPASGGVNPGQIPNLLSLLSTIQHYIDKMDNFISKRAGITSEKFHAMIAHELWLDAEDATALKFNDEIVYLTNEFESSAPVSMDERLKNIRR